MFAAGLMLALWLGTQPEMTLKRVVDFEQPKGELGWVQPLSVAGDETAIYILDIGQKVIHHYSPEGRYLASLGRPGKGPGELDMSDGYGALGLDKDLLYVFDRRRIHVFDRKTGYLRTQDVGGKGYGRWSEFLRFQGRTLISDMSWRNKNMRLLLLDDALEVASEVDKLADARFGANAKGGTDYAPFAANYILAVDGDRLWFANWCEPKLTQVDRDGKSQRSFRLPIQNGELPTEAIAQHKTFFERMRKDKDAMLLPDKTPYLAALFPLDQDRLAVRKYTYDESHFTGLVVATDGKVLAHFDDHLSEWVRGIAYRKQILMITYDSNEEYHLALGQLVPK